MLDRFRIDLLIALILALGRLGVGLVAAAKYAMEKYPGKFKHMPYMQNECVACTPSRDMSAWSGLKLKGVLTNWQRFVMGGTSNWPIDVGKRTTILGFPRPYFRWFIVTIVVHFYSPCCWALFGHLSNLDTGQLVDLAGAILEIGTTLQLPR